MTSGRIVGDGGRVGLSALEVRRRARVGRRAGREAAGERRAMAGRMLHRGRGSGRDQGIRDQGSGVRGQRVKGRSQETGISGLRCPGAGWLLIPDRVMPDPRPWLAIIGSSGRPGHLTRAERYRSGRNGGASKASCPQAARGFESHPLRQIISFKINNLAVQCLPGCNGADVRRNLRLKDSRNS